jgi:adenylosuccinate synthase
VRHAVRINGITGIALTKLDVLTGFKEIRICTAYRYKETIHKEFPASLRVMEKAEAVYEDFDGWQEPISHAHRLADLPTNAQRYVRRLEEILQTEMVLISVGPDREQTIMLKNPFRA